jgi:uncharacterized protein (DUF2062 family)
VNPAAPSIRQAPCSRKPWWRRAWRTLVRSVRGAVLLDDTPERIARGCACGIATAFLPGPGQLPYALLASRLAGGNLVACVPWSFITNPFTTLPIWYGCYRLGALFLPGHQVVGWHDMAALVERLRAASWSEAFTGLFTLFGSVLLPLLLGTVLLGLVLGVLVYFSVRWLVERLQARRRVQWRRWSACTEPPAAAHD